MQNAYMCLILTFRDRHPDSRKGVAKSLVVRELSPALDLAKAKFWLPGDDADAYYPAVGLNVVLCSP